MMNVIVLKSPHIPKAQGDIYEFRLDAFEEINLDQIAKLMRGRKVIFTYPGAKRATLEALLELNPTYIDLDHKTDPAFIKRIQCKIICSYHNFDMTPSDLDAIPLFDADEQKMATQALSILDSMRMLHHLKKKKHFTGICMGEEGKITRQLGPLFGSTFNFLNAGEPSAPGQLTPEEVLPCHPTTRVYGLIGDPITFSPSDITHNRVFQDQGLDAIYVKMRVKSGELPQFMQAIQDLPLDGLSVTIPHKEQVVPGHTYNTLKRQGADWAYRNTDGEGAVKAIERRMSLEGKELLFIGAGGAAKGIMAFAEKRGAKIKFFNRTIKKIGYRQIYEKEPYDVLINTTPLYKECPLDPDWILPGSLVFDIIARPKETALLMAAKKRDCGLIYGEEMFVEQAILQFAWWFEGRIDLSKIRDSLLKGLNPSSDS